MLFAASIRVISCFKMEVEVHPPNPKIFQVQIKKLSTKSHPENARKPNLTLSPRIGMNLNPCARQFSFDRANDLYGEVVSFFEFLIALDFQVQIDKTV